MKLWWKREANYELQTVAAAANAAQEISMDVAIMVSLQHRGADVVATGR